jgi:hypothetical protein
MLTDFHFKQKQIATLGNNAGYQTYWKEFYDKFLKGRETHTTNPKDYYNIIPQHKFTTQINQKATSNGLSTKYPKLFECISSGKKGLKELGRVKFINQFYNDKPSHEDRATLNKLLCNLYLGKSLKEHKRDSLNSFYNKYTPCVPSTDLSLLNYNNFITTDGLKNKSSKNNNFIN